MPTFLDPPDKPDFPTEEVKILKYWEEIDAFQESLRQSEGKPPYNFYDGPPFATGMPHYGHILAGTIKDVVTRHAHQRGFHVERRFGWDCHGVPVEGIIDAKLNIKGRQDVIDMGIGKYNEECRSIVSMYVNEWRTIITRYGRWIDFDNDYKTMEPSYMESLWWVFKQLFDKGMVYRAYRVLAYSTALCTSLSNFEANQNYQEVRDPSVIVKFKRKDKENSWILAWTTTPWTLPSNLALCVGPTLKYLRVKSKADGEEWIVGKDRWEWICKNIKKDSKKYFEIQEEVEGSQLVGIPYQPLFTYFEGKVSEKAWHVVSDTYVGTGAGTMIVHQAPAFGEDDNRVCKRTGIVLKDGTGMVDPIDEAGKFKDPVSDFKGQHIKEADNGIKKKLKDQGNLVWSGVEVHNYPMCWRSDTPLMYKACPTWFIKVEEIRDRLVENNKKTNWTPDYVKEKRFHNWLSEARDWNVSRTRYWGTPLPLWVSDDYEEIICIGSVAELEELSGRKVTDLHRHFIDDILIPSKKGKGMLKRVDEVFDCWFESGGMPYASKHYPFERKEEFEKGFPAQFIAEGLDQTRGWFYTLMVLSTILFDKPPFQNLIVNGLVLAEDGKKMSKRLKNYPDPVYMCDNFGADAVRMYMCNSPVVRAEPLKFAEGGVREVVKNVFLPLYNAYRFLVGEATRYEASENAVFKQDSERIKKSTNLMDRWINASSHQLIKFVREEMDAYRLYTVVGGLTKFLEELTNWYIRLNRDRIKGDNGIEETVTALCTLYDAILNVTVMLAAVTPFITEMIYQNLARALPDGHPLKAKSVHFVMVPEYDPEALDPDIQRAVASMQTVIELGRVSREQRQIAQKMPLKSMTIFNRDETFRNDITLVEAYVKDEINAVEMVLESKPGDEKLTASLNFKVAGKKLGKDMKAVKAAVEGLSQEEQAKFDAEGKITVCGHELVSEDVSITRAVAGLDNPNLHTSRDNETKTMMVLDFTPDPELTLTRDCREIATRVNQLKKASKMKPDDPIDIWAEVVDPKKDSPLQTALMGKVDFLDKLLRRRLFRAPQMQGHEVVVKTEDYEVNGEKLRVTLTDRTVFFNDTALVKLSGEDAAVGDGLREHLKKLTLTQLSEAQTATVSGTAYKLVRGEHFSCGPAEAEWIKAGFAPTARTDKQEAASKKDAKPKKEAKKDGKAGKSAEAAEPTPEELEELRKKKLKKVLKEGGKRGVEIEGAADMGGLQFFCTMVEEPDGDLDLLVESMKAMNEKSDPTEEERKGGSGRIGKMIFSAGTDQLAIVAYVPEEKQGELSCEEWLQTVLGLFSGSLCGKAKDLCSGFVKTDSEKNIFPLKIREALILEANNFLRKKGLFPEDNGDSDEMVFGDDDFPS